MHDQEAYHSVLRVAPVLDLLQVFCCQQYLVVPPIQHRIPQQLWEEYLCLHRGNAGHQTLPAGTAMLLVWRSQHSA